MMCTACRSELLHDLCVFVCCALLPHFVVQQQLLLVALSDWLLTSSAWPELMSGHDCVYATPHVPCACTEGIPDSPSPCACEGGIVKQQLKANTNPGYARSISCIARVQGGGRPPGPARRKNALKQEFVGVRKVADRQCAMSLQSKQGHLGMCGSMLQAARMRLFLLLALQQSTGKLAEIARHPNTKVDPKAEKLGWVCKASGRFVMHSAAEQQQFLDLASKLAPGAPIGTASCILQQQNEQVTPKPAATRPGPPAATLLQSCAIPTANQESSLCPAAFGVYCDRQVDRQCGAHALNALLGAGVIAGPAYCYPDLQLTTQGYPVHSLNPEFVPTGNYSVEALNHWLYEHTHVDACLAHVVKVMPGVSYTRAEILAKCPAACAGLFLWLWYEHPSIYEPIPHYKAWVQHAECWYECESMEYSRTNRVKQLTDSDWTRFTGEVYCLVKADAYCAGKTLLQPPRGADSFVLDGDSLQTFECWRMRELLPHITSQPVRRVSDLWNADRVSVGRSQWQISATAQPGCAAVGADPHHSAASTRRSPRQTTQTNTAVHQPACKSEPSQPTEAIKDSTPNMHTKNSSRQKHSSLTLAEATEKFEREISGGCKYECCSCHQTFFQKGVKQINEDTKHRLQGTNMWRYLDHTATTVDGRLYMCTVCHKALTKKKNPHVPKLNGQRGHGNSICMVDQPTVLKRLNDLEATLVGIYIPFMTMFTRRTRGGQWAMQGSIANVPLDVYNSECSVWFSPATLAV